MSQSPIYDGFASPPPTYPLGVPIADKVKIREIDRRTADRVYQSHHSYLPRGRCGWHYGVYFDGSIVGAISFDNWPSEGTIRSYESSEIIEVSRVCIAHDTPNLASCAMSKAQDKFLEQHDGTVEMLVTYVREDYNGSMFSALKGKGWQEDKASPAGSDSYSHNNKSDWEQHAKIRWVCEVED